jgi:hypothetical protein
MIARWLLALACVSATVFAQQPPEKIDNAALIRMTRAGIDEGTILKLIEGSHVEFDTSVSALIALKDAGVSSRVIDGVVTRAKTGKPATELYPRPEEVGVYTNIGERLVPLKVELITWREGGYVKSLTLKTRGHLNGMLSKPLSPLRLASRIEFIIHTPEGVAAEEYQLLRFWEKRDRREFRLMTGGVFHASSGADMNLVAVDVETIGTRLYKVTPKFPLQDGEYGVLPPGAALSASAASAGKIYTFGVKAER